MKGAIGLMVKLSDNLTQDHYFLPDPDKFIFEFFPMEPVWKTRFYSSSIAWPTKCSLHMNFRPGS